MNPQILFILFSALAFICWIPLLAIPYHKFTTKYVQYFGAPIFFAIVYIICFTYTVIVADSFSVNAGILDYVIKMFQGSWGFLTGWVHYLCFDLVVGSYMVIGAKKIQLNKGILFVCLLLTFMAGPIGFLIFRAIKLSKSRN